MSDTWNLEIVADSKPEAPPEKPPENPLGSAAGNPIEDSGTTIPSVLSNDHSLGAIMTMAREARGFSRDQAAKASNIPGYYLTMIETDDYSSIADQLYLLPFLRRYAVFVALEPEEVASRFIREVQRADMNPGRSSEPIAMFEPRKPIPWRMIMTIAWAIIAIARRMVRLSLLRGAQSLDGERESSCGRSVDCSRFRASGSASRRNLIRECRGADGDAVHRNRPRSCSFESQPPRPDALGGSCPSCSSARRRPARSATEAVAQVIGAFVFASPWSTQIGIHGTSFVDAELNRSFRAD